MPRIEIPAGKDSLVVKVPEGTTCQIIAPKEVLEAGDELEIVRRAIENPIGSKRLKDMVKPADRVALVVTDITREIHEREIIPILLEELALGGIERDNITIVVACGTHRPNTPAEIEQMFGDAVKGYRVINHDPYDKNKLTYLGESKRGVPIFLNKVVTDADIRVTTGGIEPHLFAGYSGGVKSISVGTAGEETIAATHNLRMTLEHPRTRLGVIGDNIFRQFLTEVAMVVGIDFVVNVVQTGDKRLAKVTAGHPIDAFEEAVKTAAGMYEVAIPRPADVVLSFPGYPKDRDLYQAVRAGNTVLFGPSPAVRRGGVLIIPARCQDGLGHEGFHDILASSPSAAEALETIRRKERITPGELVGYKTARFMIWCSDVYMTDCEIPEETLRRMHFKVAKTAQEALDIALGRSANPYLVVMPYGTMTIPMVQQAEASACEPRA